MALRCFLEMASTCSFVGAPRPFTAARRISKPATRGLTVLRAEGDVAAPPVKVTPASVAGRSGSASVKGTVRKQNEDRAGSYVSQRTLRRVTVPRGSPTLGVVRLTHAVCPCGRPFLSREATTFHEKSFVWRVTMWRAHRLDICFPLGGADRTSTVRVGSEGRAWDGRFPFLAGCPPDSLRTRSFVLVYSS